MKKTIIAAAICCATATLQAASVDWSATATSTYNGLTMYLLTSIEASYASVAALETAAVDAGVVAKSGKVYSVAKRTATDDKITGSANYYLAVLDTSDATKLHYMDVTTTMREKVYQAPNPTPGTFSVAFADVLASATTATVAPVPEPTSGLMLLLGVAGLALRRKRA